jgi:hypothetical protein
LAKYRGSFVAEKRRKKWDKRIALTHYRCAAKAVSNA